MEKAKLKTYLEEPVPLLGSATYKGPTVDTQRIADKLEC